MSNIYKRILDSFRSNPESLLRQLGIHANLKRRGNQIETNCPLHEDKNPSFSISLSTGQWMCFAGCGSGNLMQLWDELDNLSEIQSHRPPEIYE